MEDEILYSIKIIAVYVNGLFPVYSHCFIAVGSCAFSFYLHNICFAPEIVVIIITFYRFPSVEEKNNKHGPDSEQMLKKSHLWFSYLLCSIWCHINILKNTVLKNSKLLFCSRSM